MKSFFRKGFTLIELLVVIGVLAVVGAGVVALINPQDKIRQANDAKIINDIGQLATAAQSYAAQQASGSYPNSSAALTPGELSSVPSTPAGAAYGWAALDSGGGACTGLPADPCATLVISAALTSQKYSATPAWVWCSLSGKAGATANITTCP